MIKIILILLTAIAIGALSFKYKKLHLYVCAALFPIMPTYWAFEITPTFPLITVGRLVLVYTFLFTLLNTKKERYLEAYNYFKKSKLIWFVATIVLVKGISTVAALPSAPAIKNYLSFGVEQLGLVLCLCLSIDSEECVERLFHILLSASMILVVSAIVESFWGYNVFFVFSPKFERSYISHVSYVRLGIVRASGPFEHPIALALYTLFVYSIAIYKYLTSKKYLKYGVMASALILMELLTVSRFPILCMGLITLLFIILGEKYQRVRMGKLIAVIVSFVIAMFPFISTTFGTTLYRIIASLLDCTVGKVTGFNFSEMVEMLISRMADSGAGDINAGLLDNLHNLQEKTGGSNTVDFGTNANPYKYRFFLFEVAYDVLKKNPLFGLGGSYFQNNYYDISHMAHATFRKLKSVDNAYLYLLITEGSISFIGTVSYYLSALWINMKQWKENKGITIEKMFVIVLVGYYIALLSSGMLGSIRIACVMIAIMFGNQIVKQRKDTL